MSNRVKDGIRQFAIQDIVKNFFDMVLTNMQTLDSKMVADTLHVLAQLIDWNELQYFESLVQSCIEFLQNPEVP